MKQFRKILCTAFLLCFLLQLSTAGAESQIENLLDTLGSEAGLSWNADIRTDIGMWPLYSQERLEKLNLILRHFSFRFSRDKSRRKGSVLADGEDMLTWEERDSEEGTTYFFSADPEHLYFLQKGQEPAFLPAADDADILNADHYIRLRQWTGSFYTFFDRITALFPEEAATSAMEMKYKEYHTAVVKETLTISEEAMAELQSRTNELFPAEPQAAVRFFTGLVFSGKQKIVLQRDENGQLVRISYNGKAGTSEETLRTISLDWKVLRENGREADQFQIKTPSVKGSVRDNLALKRTLTFNEDGSESWNLTLEEDKVENRIHTVKKTTADISFAEKSFTGSFLEKVNSAGSSEECSIEFLFQNASDSRIVGTLEITKKKGKIETTRMSAEVRLQTYDETDGGNDGNAVPDSGIVPFDAEAAEALKIHIAETLLQKIMTFPQEDLIFLSEDIPEDDWLNLTGK